MNLLFFWFILCLPSFGFACRGIALLRMKEAKPGRMFSMSGVVAAISMLVFAIVTPMVVADLDEIFKEFGVDLPPFTKLMMSLTHMYLRCGIILRCVVGLVWGLAAMTVPEIFFYQPRPGLAGVSKP